MNDFDLVVRDAQGQVQALSMQATDRAAAVQHVERGGSQVLACTIARNRLAIARTPRRRNKLDVTSFSFELAALVSAGLQVPQSLRTLAGNEPPGPGRDAILGLERAVNEGLPLSDAMMRSANAFPPLLVATVRASEQTGDLSTSLNRYAGHQQMVKAFKDKIVAASIYPALLLVVGCAVVAFLLTVVVPKFSLLIESSRRELPWSSRLLMSWGRLAADNAGLLGLLALALLAAAFAAAWSAAAKGGRTRWIERLPIVGPTVRRFRHTELYRSTGMLVRGGIAIPNALQLAGSLLGPADHDRLQHALRLIREGRSPSAALQSSGLADPVACSMLAVAEQTGDLAGVLDHIAHFHEARLQRSVDMSMRLFEPVLMIGIGLVVGTIVVLMYLPIFDLASSLQ